MTTVTREQENTQRVLREAEEWTAGWAALTAFLRDHSYISEEVGHIYGAYALISVDLRRDPVEFISRVAADAVKAGAKVEPFRDSTHGGIKAFFGPASLKAFAKVDATFANKVVGQVDKVEYSPLFSIPSQDGEEK